MRKDLLDITETDVEGRLVRLVNKNGGLAWKFCSPNNRSVPDRIVLLNGWLFFVELKRPGKDLTEKQAEKFKDIRAQGGHAYMINNYEACEFIVDLYMLASGPYCVID